MKSLAFLLTRIFLAALVGGSAGFITAFYGVSAWIVCPIAFVFLVVISFVFIFIEESL